jgi:hypothetical protein
VEEPAFMPLYRRHANSAGFPDVGPAFQRLGIDVEDDELHIHRGTELAHIREAITGRTL